MPLSAKSKIFLSIAFVFTYMFDGSSVLAKEVSVFEIRRPIAMQNDEHPPKDVYINAGSKDGLKTGMIVNVERRQALYDMYKNKSPGDLVVTIGKIRIIHVQPDFSVARIVSIASYDDTPAVDFSAIMVGDQVDLSSARFEAKKTAMLDSAPSSVAVQLPVTPQVTVPATPQVKPPQAPNLSPTTAGAANLSSLTP